ncbi:MAG: hypothetical protein GEU82_09590 [Luteitalea sp.]|nr:hypothetical protein [Luteitalea sp.]
MPDFNVRSDSVSVEQIMEQIRARIREKRGADYTEDEIRQLATVKLEKFLDPRGVRSDLLDQFRRAQPAHEPPELPNYAFEEQTLFESTRGPLRWIRRLLLPILKLFFNPNPLIQALNIQSRLNTIHAERDARRDAAARSVDQLQYEVLHNLVVELTRTGIEVKNLKMQVESLASRLEFNERRARSLESVVVYKPSGEVRTPTPPTREPRQPEEPPVRQAAPANESQGPAVAVAEGAEGPGQRSRRRRRRRGRRSGASAAGVMSAAPADRNADATSESEDVLDRGDDSPEPAAAPTEGPAPAQDAAAGGADEPQ